MKIARIGKEKIIMSAPDERYNYFAWPSAKRLPDGRIAVGASGFRLRHVCPFGKAVMMFSEDDGESYYQSYKSVVDKMVKAVDKGDNDALIQTPHLDKTWHKILPFISPKMNKPE